jgi:hypothetical protein
MFSIFFGPNMTTFIIPSRAFPPEVRSTFNGFSAALGKLGAAFGTAIFAPLSNRFGIAATLLTCAAFAVVGGALTYMGEKAQLPGDTACVTFCITVSTQMTKQAHDRPSSASQSGSTPPTAERTRAETPSPGMPLSCYMSPPV